MKPNERFQAWIDARGMKQSFICANLPCSTESIRMWLSGDRTPLQAQRILIEQFTEKHGEKLPRDIWGG